MKIVKRILTVVTVTDETKFKNFFKKQINQYTKEIKILKRNIDTLIEERTEKIEEYLELINEINEKVEKLYTSISISDIETDNFANIYWNRILKEEKAVKVIELQIEKLKENVLKQIEEIEQQIKERERRLEKIQ